MFRIGNWKYLKSNNTLNYKSDEYSYQIDLDRNGSPESWLKHLLGKNDRVMPDSALRNMLDCYQKLGHQIDKSEAERLFDFWSGQRT